MMRYRMTVAYDGTMYSGWQRQLDPVPTVQRVVEKAAGGIVSHPVIVKGSSRTDQGVHACGQVATMEADTHLEPERLRRAINSRLPEDVMIRTMDVAPEGFDVRRPQSKRYRYLIWADRDRPLFYRHYVYHYWHRLDVDLMQQGCSMFEGEHDFDAFRGRLDERETTVRTILRCTVHRRGPMFVFAVEGTGFLYHMVRNMVGTALEVGRGNWRPERVREIIESKDHSLCGPCAPAQGLCLQWIRF